MRKALIESEKLKFLKGQVTNPKNVAKLLLVIFKKHIGIENEITREELFKKVYETDFEYNYENFYKYDVILKAMHFLRRYTNCFIASRNIQSTYSFFVISSESELQMYSSKIKRAVRALNNMNRRATKAVEEQWHKQKWVLPKPKRYLDY